MRPIARQSARLAIHSRSTQHLRSFNSTALRRTDARPTNGPPEHNNALPEQPREDQSRAGSAANKPERVHEAENAEAKTSSEGRRTMRRSLRQSRRATEVPKPPPIPQWFLKHNVHLVKSIASDSAVEHGTKEVLRCVDAQTGHTLFTVPYYELSTPRATTTIRGKEVDISSLDMKKDVVTGLPDHLKEEMMIHHLQVQRAKRPDELDQAGLAELLVALPRDMQEEILRRETVEWKRMERDETADYVRIEAEPGKKRTVMAVPKGNPLGQNFFGQKVPIKHTSSRTASSNDDLSALKDVGNETYPLLSWVLLEAEASISAGLSLPNNTHPARLFSSSRVDLSLQCPDVESSFHLNILVRNLAQAVGADVVKLDANDLAELASEYVDGGRDSPGSFSTLGYEVFEGLHAHGLGRSPKIFGNAQEEDDAFDMEEDDMEDDMEDDEEDEHRNPGVEFGTMDDLRKALQTQRHQRVDDLRKAIQDQRHQVGKLLSMRVARLQISTPRMIGISGPPSDIVARREKMAGDEEGEEVRFDATRLTALLDGLVDAARQKRADNSDEDTGSELDLVSQKKALETRNESNPRLARVATARMLASCVASGAEVAEKGVKLQSQQSLSHAESTATRSPRTIIHVRDLKDIYRSELGARVIQSLVKVVQRRRRSGESVLIVGTTAQDQSNVFMSGQQESASNYTLRTLTVPPLFTSSTDDIGKLEASILPALNGALFEDGDLRILHINLRHIRGMLSRLRPGQELDFRNRSATAQLALRGTYPLAGKVLSFDQIQRLVLTAIGLAETHAKSDAVQLVHIALATILTSKVDQIVQTWSSNDRVSKMSKAFRPGGKGKDGAESSDADAAQSKLDDIKSSCNPHESRLLTGVVDAKNIKTGFADVHAPPSTIEALKTLTSLSLLRPEAFTYGVLAHDRLPGLLLYGPPGTGKTLLAKAVAKDSRATVLEVTGAQIYEKYVGEGEKMVRAVFTLAKKLSPCVVFIDEADAIFGSRSNGGGNRNTHREIINQFLKEWDGMDDQGVFIMVASNRPFDLDDAVLRRLPRRVLVDLPVVKDRESVLEIHLNHESLDPAVELNKLAERTPLYSGSDLKNLCVAAALACVREENELAVSHQDDKDFKLPEKRVLAPRHFEKAITEISASISEDMSSLGAIRKFDEQYGDRSGRRKKAGYGFGGGDGVVDERSVMIRQSEFGPAEGTAPP